MDNSITENVALLCLNEAIKMALEDAKKTRIVLGSIVVHSKKDVSEKSGTLIGYEGDTATVLFVGGETQVWPIDGMINLAFVMTTSAKLVERFTLFTDMVYLSMSLGMSQREAVMFVVKNSMPENCDCVYCKEMKSQIEQFEQEQSTEPSPAPASDSTPDANDSMEKLMAALRKSGCAGGSGIVN